MRITFDDSMNKINEIKDVSLTRLSLQGKEICLIFSK